MNGENRMSGNSISNIEDINRCPCCDEETEIAYLNKTYIDGKPFLCIKFSHRYETYDESRDLQSKCECFSESNGYFVYIPLGLDLDEISQEWY